MTKHQRSIFLSVFAVFLSLTSPRVGHAQSELATVRGTVTDQQGATVPQTIPRRTRSRTGIRAPTHKIRGGSTKKFTLNLGVRYDGDNTILAGNQYVMHTITCTTMPGTISPRSFPGRC